MRFAALLLAMAAAVPAMAQEQPVQMTQYVIVVLRTGSDHPAADSATLTRVRKGHMDNIRAMGATGKLLTAGPIGGAEGVQGIFVFAPGVSRSEIATLLRSDPAIAEKFLVAEYWDWYAPTGLRVVPPGG